jgi:tetratricopeptide (TPR) repeat protein
LTRAIRLPVSLVLLLGGCATALGQGQLALRQGRYEDAALHFREALASQERADARFGLGVALYQLGDFAGAAKALTPAVKAAPRNPDARLFLALTYLQTGDEAAAREHLTELRSVAIHPRLSAQVGRALDVMALDGLPSPMRRFVAASLEDEAQWERELREAHIAPRAPYEPTWTIYGDGSGWYPYGWYPYIAPVPQAR